MLDDELCADGVPPLSFDVCGDADGAFCSMSPTPIVTTSPFFTRETALDGNRSLMSPSGPLSVILPER